MLSCQCLSPKSWGQKPVSHEDGLFWAKDATESEGKNLRVLRLSTPLAPVPVAPAESWSSPFSLGSLLGLFISISVPPAVCVGSPSVSHQPPPGQASALSWRPRMGRLT